MDSFLIIWLFICGLVFGVVYTRRHYLAKQEAIAEKKDREDMALLKEEIEKIKTQLQNNTIIP